MRRERGRWKNGGDRGDRDFSKYSKASGRRRRRDNGWRDGVGDVVKGVTGVRWGMSDRRNETKGMWRWRWNNNGLTHIEAVWRRRSWWFVDGLSPCGVEVRCHRRSEHVVEVIEPCREFVPRS